MRSLHTLQGVFSANVGAESMRSRIQVTMDTMPPPDTGNAGNVCIILFLTSSLRENEDNRVIKLHYPFNLHIIIFLPSNKCI